MSFWEQYKYWIIGGGVLYTVSSGFGKGKKMGVSFKNETEPTPASQYDDIDLPGDTVTQPVNLPLVKAIEARLYQYVNGWNLFLVDELCQAYTDALALNDNSFVSLANLYKNNRGITLREDINETYLGCDNFVGIDPKIGMFNRLDALNIP